MRRKGVASTPWMHMGPRRENPTPAIIHSLTLDLLDVNTYYIHTYKTELVLKFVNFVKSDFWGWGLSVWPLVHLMYACVHMCVCICLPLCTHGKAGSGY